MTTSRTALLVIPASNTTVVPEMAALLPGYGCQLAARVPATATPLTPETIPDLLDTTLAATEPFIRDRPDLVIYGCTAAGFLGGVGGNQAMVEGLTGQFGAPVVSMAGAMLEALRHSRAHRIAVVTPYLQPVNDGLRAFLAAAGIEVTVLDSFECPTLADLCALTERDVLERALVTGSPSHDALFIACSQLPSLGILPVLRERLHIPVWSSVSATAWVAARHASGAARAA